jgi:ADP-ribose pyrophosphatase
VTLREWPVIESREVADMSVFKVRVDRCLSPRDGRAYDFAVIDSPDWVNIVPITPEGNVVFVRQYRIGTKSVSLETPGGLVERDEPPEVAALRELREETGYTTDRLTLLGKIAPNPAIQNNTCWIYIAERCTRAGEATPDEREELAAEEIPLARVPQLVVDGVISHVIVAYAFYMLELRDRGVKPAAP